jgi:hypothetical protein
MQPTNPPQLTITPALQAIFYPAWWNHLPSAVSRVRTMDQRGAVVETLIAQGYAPQIDLEIVLWNWDPLNAMAIRRNGGYTWIPNPLQPNIGTLYTEPNGDSTGSQLPYPKTPPQDSIIVPPVEQLEGLNDSDATVLIATWYPPYGPPKPIPSAPTDPVGAQVGNLNMYRDALGVDQSNWPIGAEYDLDPRGKFVHHGTATPFGIMGGYWSLLDVPTTLRVRK